MITAGDLANWQVKFEEPRHANYRGIDVYKLDRWTQGPAMLQALNILENFDLKSMGYNSGNYIHTVYQAMNLAFADRDFYYGDPYFPPEEPIEGLLSKDYAKQRAAAISPGAANDPAIGPGDPYPFQGGTNPHADLLKKRAAASLPAFDAARFAAATDPVTGSFYRGTTSVVAADKDGWLVSMTPSGAWLPAVIAGRTGVGMSQRAQQFVIDPAVEPVQRDRARQAPARDADAFARLPGRQALARLRRAGRRHAGPEPAAVLPQHRRVRHDAAAGRRGAEHHQLPDARLLLPARALRRAASRSTTRFPTGSAAT